MDSLLGMSNDLPCLEISADGDDEGRLRAVDKVRDALDITVQGFFSLSLRWLGWGYRGRGECDVCVGGGRYGVVPY